MFRLKYIIIFEYCVLKVEEDPQVPALATEVNEKMVKRKRRNKRSSSNLMFNKWSKVYVTETSENNISVENQDESCK